MNQSIYVEVSFKNKRMNTGNDITMNRDKLDEEDIDILNANVVTDLIGGISSIKFPDSVHSLVEGSMANTVTYAIWKPLQTIELMGLEKEYYTIKFKMEVDYMKILAEKPWIIFGQYLLVQPWSPEFAIRGMFSNMVINLDLGRPLILKVKSKTLFKVWSMKFYQTLVLTVRDW
ncbi:hypothetical protein GOBAR_AA25411 [Gossypium barbadense]|uniref:DUF4283 domain-containing protein n=1 Tax=Gossypium barbadense TaxID=3634 RepID=A0A2P5WW45_GOSBA|nr:hypothetical protein GOBAR_AA25411 [Gossypium barbadense]